MADELKDIPSPPSMDLDIPEPPSLSDDDLPSLDDLEDLDDDMESSPENPQQENVEESDIQSKPTQDKPAQEPDEIRTLPESAYTEEVKKGIDEIEERKSFLVQNNVPLFLRIEDFKLVLGAIDEMKVGLKDTENKFKELVDIKDKMDKEYESWKTLELDLYRKLIFIEKTLGM
jgi:hypothetical protein